MMYQVLVSYEDAQKLVPVFEHFAKNGQWREIREDAKEILRELRLVQPIEYEFGGRQIIFHKERLQDFFNNVANALGI